MGGKTSGSSSDPTHIYRKLFFALSCDGQLINQRRTLGNKEKATNPILQNKTPAVCAELARNQHPGAIVGDVLFGLSGGHLDRVFGDFGGKAVVRSERFLLSVK